MEALGETIENVGLAQEINNGLANSLQKAPKWSEFEPEIAAYRESLGAKSGWEVFGTNQLTKWCVKEWAKAEGYDLSQGRRRSNAGAAAAPTPPTEAGVNANWADFKSSSAFEVICKYMALGDRLVKEKPEKKLFEEMRPLGRGAFGAVWLVFKKDTGKPMATKRMFKTNAKENKMLNDVMNEKEVLGKMTSRFCVNLHYAFQSDTELSLTITLMPGGDLAFLLQSRYPETKKKEDRKFNPLPPATLQFYAASMALGLQAIHDVGYVYRDLKPQNVLLDAEGQIRLSDMGLVAYVKDKPIAQKSGTRGYWSPETINKDKYTYEPDWWSLGVTIYVLASDKLPFKGADDDAKDASTVAGVIEYNHEETPEVQGIINSLCTVDMATRCGGKGGIEDLKKHPYFAGFNWYSLIEGEFDAEIKPNPNDINAPSKKDIEGFKASKAVTWDPEDQAKFANWEHFDLNLWYDEATFRITKKKEIGGKGGGGGGCCTVA